MNATLSQVLLLPRHAPAPAPRPETRDVTVIPGDGVGPEVVEAALRVLEAAGARLRWTYAEAGARVARRGAPGGLPAETADAVLRTGLVLKGPLARPPEGGAACPEAAFLAAFDAFVTVRHARTLPGVPAPLLGCAVDVRVVRENLEGPHAAVEHMPTPRVAQSLSVHTRAQCERAARAAFEVARAAGRQTLYCATRADQLPMSEGLLRAAFLDLARHYPDVGAEALRSDEAARRLVAEPGAVEVVLAGGSDADLLAAVAAALVGGERFVWSASLGEDVAVFEPAHGAAPALAGRGVANPTGALLAAAALLRHAGQWDTADTVEHALLVTLEEGVRTPDVPGARAAVDTAAFTGAVIGNLGRRHADWTPPPHRPLRVAPRPARPEPEPERRTAGIDLFLEADDVPEALADFLADAAAGTAVELVEVHSRGARVHPPGAAPEPHLADFWRARFLVRDPLWTLSEGDVLSLLARLGAHVRWAHVEKLYEYDGVAGFAR